MTTCRGHATALSLTQNTLCVARESGFAAPARLPVMLPLSPLAAMQYVCHAEINAIMNKTCESLKGCRVC